MAVRVATGILETGNYGNDDQLSCLGFAGQGSGHAKQIWLRADWRIEINDNFNINFGLSNIRIGQTDTLDADYQFYLAVVPGPQTMPNYVPGNAKASKNYEIDLGGVGGNRIAWTRDIGTFGPFNIGHVDNYTFEGDAIVIWIGGCTTYHVDDPVYPSSFKITLSPVATLTDYYPWARMINSRWMSHNRDGGSLKRMVDGSYRDVKNAKIAGRTNRGFAMHDNAWVKSPITGSQGD